MSKVTNYIVRERFHNDGKQNVTSKLHELVVDAFESVQMIEDLDDLEDDVASVVRDMIEHIIDGDPNLDIVNYKVVANKNNNATETLPLYMDVIYRHKDSVFPTILRYKVMPLPKLADEDKFAVWKK